MSLLFNMLSSFVKTFLLRSKHLLISWLQSPSAMILEPQKTQSATIPVFPSICHEDMGPDTMILVFWMLSFKPTFPLSSFTFIKRLFSSSSLCAIMVVSSGYLRQLIFLLAILIPACASSQPSVSYLSRLPQSLHWNWVPTTSVHALKTCHTWLLYWGSPYSYSIKCALFFPEPCASAIPSPLVVVITSDLCWLILYIILDAWILRAQK